MENEQIRELSAMDVATAGEKKRICPPQHVRVLDNFLRPLLHNPRKLFGPYVRPGMTALDVGCGGGFSSIGLARLVGEDGRVIAADLQTEMLDVVEERAHEAGLSERIITHRCGASQVGVRDDVGFAVAFWMVHEVPDGGSLLNEIFSLLEPGGHFFVAEPRLHVSRDDFECLIEQALDTGFAVVDRPRVLLSRAVVLDRP